mgnify:CR=1 FL=1
MLPAVCDKCDMSGSHTNNGRAQVAGNSAVQVRRGAYLFLVGLLNTHSFRLKRFNLLLKFLLLNLLFEIKSGVSLCENIFVQDFTIDINLQPYCDENT